MLQPTSPFRSIETINKAYKIFMKHKKKYSVVSFKEGLNNKQRVFNIKKNKVVIEKNIKQINLKNICKWKFLFCIR